MSHVRFMAAVAGILLGGGVALSEEKKADVFKPTAADITDQRGDVSAIEKTLDRFHEAASKADGTTYFKLFAPEGVFLGTDATERWTVEEFKTFAAPHFAKGRGWTYVPTNRHVSLVPGMTPGSEVAFFDEILDNKSYGLCRGTGVLRKIAGEWRVSQYQLTIPVPNELAESVVGLIRKADAPKPTPSPAPTPTR